MRFMTMVKSSENSGPPPQALMEAIAKLGEENAKAGVMTEMGGLFPSVAGARVRLAGGKLTVIDGPFVETKEVVEATPCLKSSRRKKRSNRRCASWSCTKNIGQAGKERPRFGRSSRGRTPILKGNSPMKFSHHSLFDSSLENES